MRVEIDITGNLKLKPQGQEVQSLPLKAQVRQVYKERTLPDMAGRQKYVRYYDEAASHAEVGRGERDVALREDRRILAVVLDPTSVHHFSPSGPLTRDELELTAGLADATVLDRFGPPADVAVGGTWTYPDVDLQLLLGLDSVAQSSVQGKLEEANERLAKVSLEGRVAGAAAGAASQSELRAKLLYDRQQRRVTWFALAVKEEREIGQAEPGFVAVTQVKLTTEPLAEAPELTDAALAGLPLEPGPAAELLQFDAPASGLRLLHDRRWRTMLNRADAVTLRLLDDGLALAHCQIARLPNLPAGKRLGMQEFQEDIEAALRERQAQLTESTQETTPGGLIALRVAAQGTVSEAPVVWVFWHLANEAGERVSLVFTLDGKLVDKFGAADQELLSSLELLPLPSDAAEPEPASREARQP